MSRAAATNAYPTAPIVNRLPLPDPFCRPGTKERITSREQWPACGRAWRDLIVDTAYGGMPPPPTDIKVETLCRGGVRRWPSQPRLLSYRITTSGGERPFSFCLRILLPQGDGPFPAIIHGDGCWWSPQEEVARAVVERGYALVMFNRTELAEDRGPLDRDTEPVRAGGLYNIYPGRSFGALAAWAWGYHRCVDLLLQQDWIAPQRIAVTGHSRGGKTALLAGLTDERIGVINDNGSCAGGSAAFRFVGDGGETLSIVTVFPSWFGSQAGLRPFIGHEDQAPFDQHCLLAAIAPRPLLLTYALDDRWSNPEGMVLCAEAARSVYRFLGVEDRLAYHLRPGPHRHDPEDFQALLDFLAWQWNAEKPARAFNSHPYMHLPQAATWTMPG